MKHTVLNAVALPSPNDLKAKLQSLAMLDAILMQDWEMRYFSFNSKWGPGEMMASMKDGEGSEFFFLFNTVGVIGKIYCKGNVLSQKLTSVLDKVPSEFSSFLGEPAFRINTATCFLWRRIADSKWSVAPIDIVQIPLLAFVADNGEYYCTWAQKYYERELSLTSVKAVFRHETLTNELVISLNSKRDLNSVLADCQEIGYRH